MRSAPVVKLAGISIEPRPNAETGFTCERRPGRLCKPQGVLGKLELGICLRGVGALAQAVSQLRGAQEPAEFGKGWEKASHVRLRQQEGQQEVYRDQVWRSEINGMLQRGQHRRWNLQCFQTRVWHLHAVPDAGRTEPFAFQQRGQHSAWTDTGPLAEAPRNPRQRGALSFSVHSQRNVLVAQELAKIYHCLRVM